MIKNTERLQVYSLVHTYIKVHAASARHHCNSHSHSCSHSHSRIVQIRRQHVARMEDGFPSTPRSGSMVARRRKFLENVSLVMISVQLRHINDVTVTWRAFRGWITRENCGPRQTENWKLRENRHFIHIYDTTHVPHLATQKQGILWAPAPPRVCDAFSKPNFSFLEIVNY